MKELTKTKKLIILVVIYITLLNPNFDLIVAWFNYPEQENFEQIVNKLHFFGKVSKVKLIDSDKPSRYVFVTLSSFKYNGWTVGIHSEIKDFYEIYKTKNRAIYIKDSTVLLLKTPQMAVGDSVFSKSGEIYYGKGEYQIW